MESRKAAFRKKFQRSGSLGIPFVPENEIANIKEYFSIDIDDENEKFSPDSHCVSFILKMPARQSSLSRAMSLLEVGTIPITVPVTVHSGLFKEKQLNVKHIESRESRKKVGDLEILLQVELNNGMTSKGVADALSQNGFDVTEPKHDLQPDIYEDDELIVPSFVRGILHENNALTFN